MKRGMRMLSAALAGMIVLVALAWSETRVDAAGPYYSLYPTSYGAQGGGTVALESHPDGVVVYLDLDGARPGTLYRISACTGSTAGPCSSAPDPMMTDTV